MNLERYPQTRQVIYQLSERLTLEIGRSEGPYLEEIVLKRGELSFRLNINESIALFDALRFESTRMIDAMRRTADEMRKRDERYYAAVEARKAKRAAARAAAKTEPTP